MFFGGNVRKINAHGINGTMNAFSVQGSKYSTQTSWQSLWYLQAYISDLSVNPTSPSFELCKRVLNKCQAIVFSEGNATTDTELADASASLSLGMSTHKVRENVMPAVVGIGAMLAGIGQPLMTRPAGDIAIAQGRRNRAFSITSSNAPLLARRNTLSGASPDTNLPRSPTSATNDSSSPISLHFPRDYHHDSPYQSMSQPDLPLPKRRSAHFNPFTSSPSLEDLHRGKAFSVSRYIRSAHQKLNRRIRPTSASSKSIPSAFDPKMTAMGHSSVPTNSAPMSPSFSQSSMSSDEITTVHKRRSTTTPRISTSLDSVENEPHSDGSDEEYSTLSKLSRDHRRSLLRSNYFRSEMQFLLALTDIATRLVIVPKQARTSALNAELTLLNHNLPAEICIPLWCPATAEKPHHHRVVRISPSDAVVLNSAERAPYLLMIEVLDDELTFDDDYSSTLYRMRRLMKHKKKKTIGSPASKAAPTSPRSTEDDAIDISECGSSVGSPYPRTSLSQEIIRSPSAAVADGLGISGTEDANEGAGDNSSERRNSKSLGEYAERMRTAAIMLAQLQQNVQTASPTPGSGRAASAKSRQDTEEIRQRIIKEMMALEEARMAKMKSEGVSSGVDGGEGEAVGGDMIQDEQLVAWVVNKDDPSGKCQVLMIIIGTLTELLAAVFFENWETKKARIRASSPYGHLPNWRLLSVIVKHGSDLRQEQFAIQLIREMQRIWQDTGVDVWVK